MFTSKGFISLCVTAWLVMDINVEAQENPGIDGSPVIDPPLLPMLPRTPFAPDTTTTRPNGFISVNASTTKTASASTSNVVSESNGVSTPTISTTATSHYTGNDKGSSGLPLELNEILLIVGLCIGIPLIIVIVALAVVIARLKKQLRQARLWLKANQTASSKNGIQQPTVGDIEEANNVTGEPYESLQPRKEIVSDGFYQSLDQSRKTDSAIISSDI